MESDRGREGREREGERGGGKRPREEEEEEEADATTTGKSAKKESLGTVDAAPARASSRETLEFDRRILRLDFASHRAVMRRAPPLPGLVPDPDAERAEHAEPEIAPASR